MKKLLLLGCWSILIVLAACKTQNNSLEMGDAAFYKLIVKEGDKIVFESKQIDNDTAVILIEEVSDKPTRDNLLMKNIRQLSINESTTFDLPNGQKGFLTLYKIVKAKDFPMYIEESNRQQKEFEKQLQLIKVNIEKQLPDFKKRRNTVNDSTKALIKEWNTGKLKSKAQSLPSGIQYVILNGSGTVQPPIRKWVWFNYCGGLESGDIVDNSYGAMPALTNLSEYKLLENLEKGAASFNTGDKVLLIIPPHLAYGDKQMGAVPPNSTLFFWVEVVNVVKF